MYRPIPNLDVSNSIRLRWMPVAWQPSLMTGRWSQTKSKGRKIVFGPIELGESMGSRMHRFNCS